MKQRKSIFNSFTPHHSYISLLFLFLLFISIDAFSQSFDNLRSELIIDAEIRPRAEYQNHYRLSGTGDFNPEFYVSQRNRLGITYILKDFLFRASPQEIHLWNKSGRFSSIGSFNFFELYLEPRLTKNLSVRIGRQALLLDNRRLFSDAPWAQQSRAHEGIRIFYKSRKLKTDLTLATTRKYSEKYDPSYSPIASHQYKLLAVHHLSSRISKHYTLTTINYGDVFEHESLSQKHYYSITNGGRLEYENHHMYLTLNTYYQWGKNAELKNISAYYLQPEVKTTFNKTTFRLGAEILSGQSSSSSNNSFNSFNINYGVSWKFMGNMNFFTKFPRDVNGKGLINPYLFVTQKVNNKMAIRADGSLFYTQYHLADPNNGAASRYLGFENDLSFEYKPVQGVNIRGGLSYLLASESMHLLEKIEGEDKMPVWSYLMVSFHPKLLHVRN